MRRYRFSLYIVVSASLGMVCLSHLRADAPDAKKEIPEIVEAAQSAMKATMAEYTFGQATTEEVHQWSRRLMEAERASGTNENAAFDHASRMRQLHRKIEALFKQGAKGGSEQDFHATRYYVLKAQAEAVKQKN